MSENFTKTTIQSWKLSITWSDGKVEGLASCLPEYLEEHLMIYFKELEDLHEKHNAELRDQVSYFENEEWKGGIK